jgi:hypothetical protein
VAFATAIIIVHRLIREGSKRYLGPEASGAPNLAPRPFALSGPNTVDLLSMDSSPLRTPALTPSRKATRGGHTTHQYVPCKWRASDADARQRLDSLSPFLLVHGFSNQQAGPVQEPAEIAGAYHAEPISCLLNERHDISNLQGDDLEGSAESPYLGGER